MPFWTLSGSSSSSTKWTEEVARQQQYANKDEIDPEISTKTLPQDDQQELPPPVSHNMDGGGAGKRKKVARIGYNLAMYWASLKRRMGTGTAPSTSSLLEESAGDSVSRTIYIPEGEDDFVDEIVVDRVWSEEINKSSVTQSENGGTPDKSGGDSHPHTGSSDHESIAHTGFWGSLTVLSILRWRLWPNLLHFFNSSFPDLRSEKRYMGDNWFYAKSLAGWSAAWLIVNWVLGLAFVPRPFTLMDKIYFYAFAPVLSVPVILMIMFNWPRDRVVLYQCFLGVSIWAWGLYQVLFMYLCGFYKPSRSLFGCGTRDFLGTMYYCTALQVIALFGLKMNRISGALGALTFFIFTCSAIAPDRTPWARTMINFASERRIFTIRDQLKLYAKQAQKAQINERKAAESKRRLTSYVFHDNPPAQVRVPLNTALLAVQNMEASGTVAKAQEIEFKALEGSLSMMSKVLNDVLDFNRMDSGRFESASRPYALHHVMRSLFIPLRLATDARNLELVTHLDPNIDLVARCAAYEALKYSSTDIKNHLRGQPAIDGLVVGDETRLRQIVTNLASNACKFTPTGGKLTVKTQLVLPNSPPEYMNEYDIPPDEPASSSSDLPLSTRHLSQHNINHNDAPPHLEWIVVRIEVSDTGCGIKRRDMVESNLFSAFNQTEQGRQQGGKGTGLGLALVRSIVKSSGGRLGVRSKVGEGSTFWVELPLGVGKKAFTGALADLGSDKSADPSDFGRFPQARSPEPCKHSPRGRVEISLDNPDSVPTRTIGDSSTGTQFELSSPADEDVPDPPPSQAREPFDDGVTHPPRPTFVQMPTQRSFTADAHPTTSTHTSGASGGIGSSPSSPSLSTFDNARGNPNGSCQTLPFESGMNVLVVDDDPLTRTLMKRILSRLGCTVSTAENGEIALEMLLAPHGETPSSDGSHSGGPILEQEQPTYFQEGKYAAVFLDNSMPVMSGLEAVTKLREMGRKDFVVGVTGNALLNDQQEYLEAGVDHVLTKPVFERSLREMLINADEKRKRGHTPNNTGAETPVVTNKYSAT
ncbi:hypothetical protein ONZ45_g6212 [Pleurotus djamor]|nr:hypothetical protein ONZ45_g6212 [Pleurotus djamor]